LDDNVGVESFFWLLKRECIKCRIYESREEVRADLFDYTEIFANPIRRHVRNKSPPPVQSEKQFSVKQVRVPEISNDYLLAESSEEKLI